MSRSPSFSLSCSEAPQTSGPRLGRHACEAHGTRGSAAVAEPQESSSFSSRPAAPSRRHSPDGTVAPERGPAARFHPYRRQFSDGAAEATGTSSFSNLQEACGPDSCSCGGDVPTTWDQYSGRVQSFYSESPAVPVDPYGSLPQSFPPYSSLSPLQQVPSKLYPNDNQPDGVKYPHQSLSCQPHQDSGSQPLFPKPIYSYSILIFMALKNSKTGSLPVSEIYSFMTEHFPYFKTAPDGWKNSVRHNLSLNKCFEKVENKNGGASRKGCLWALNPAKVEKMQDELHKWRRKDPLTVRRSMARPEDLDRLLGEKPDKLRSLPPYSTRTAPLYSPASSSSFAPGQPRPARQPSQYAHVRQPYYLPAAAAQPGGPFALYSPCGQQPVAGVPPNSPRVYGVGLPAEYGVGPRGVQDPLQDGDTSYDVDTLNPSLTDLQLQGNLWDELREDSLVSEPHVSTTSSTAFVLQDHHIQTGCLQVSPPFGHAAGAPGGCCKAAYEDEGADRSYWNGLHPVGCSGMESLAGYLASCTTSVSLM
ncbi:forkhead box protein N1 isoform X2 [Kryptolebias marmoratus]|uniref:Forkhead box N1 n=1 Tax=Kryptolebias marmoratus TaxID=37003 RepID=A0A3Q3AZA5_KRYMA|nr:forkhead box protein N1 isoform X2 [Kryptolebias marmoratus]